MTDKCKVEGCQLEKSGVCAYHNQEVQRVRAIEKMIKQIPAILSRLSWVIGILTVYTILVIGSYAYTRETTTSCKEDLKVTQKFFADSDEVLRERIFELTAAVSKQGEQQKSFIRDLEKIFEKQAKIDDRTHHLKR